jgi:glycoprotein endo-alpha-1,2-mannosidase
MHSLTHSCGCSIVHTSYLTPLQAHMDELSNSGVDVMVVSWWGRPGRGFSDTQGVNTDRLISQILELADRRIGSKKEISVAFHLEPYVSRSIDSIREDLNYIHSNYGHYRSIYREFGKIVFYVYDSYHINPTEWGRLLSVDGEISVRDTDLDGFFIGMWLDHNHGHDLSISGFDGIYSYFASSSVSYGSNPDNWRHMCSYCRKVNMACSLSVGPGYIDTGIRPWNFRATKERNGGEYYEASWSYATRSGADMISITSYNEWGEGTQIEPAKAVTHSPREGNNKKYLSYGPAPEDAYKYTNMTLEFAETFRARKLQHVVEKTEL